MIVEVEKIRAEFKNAKSYFASTIDISKYDAEQFLVAFGAVNGCKVSIDHWAFSFPVVYFVEFNSEQDYTWFMLRWK